MPVWKRVPRGPKPSVGSVPMGAMIAHRRGRRGLPESGQRLRARHRDRVDPGPALEREQRSPGARAEGAVERARGETVPREQELERRDVPTRGAGDQRPTAQRMRAELAQRRPGRRRERRRRPGQAIQGGQRLRAGVAVDVAVVQIARGQPDLERRDVRRRRPVRRLPARERRGPVRPRRCRRSGSAFLFHRPGGLTL